MKKITLVYAVLPSPADVFFGGITRLDPSGSVTILINAEKTEDEKKQLLKHELSHIILGHLWDARVNGDDLSYLDNHPEIEDEANRYADQMSDETLSFFMDGLIGETKYW